MSCAGCDKRIETTYACMEQRFCGYPCLDACKRRDLKKRAMTVKDPCYVCGSETLPQTRFCVLDMYLCGRECMTVERAIRLKFQKEEFDRQEKEKKVYNHNLCSGGGTRAF